MKRVIEIKRTATLYHNETALEEMHPKEKPGCQWQLFLYSIHTIIFKNNYFSILLLHNLSKCI